MPLERRHVRIPAAIAIVALAAFAILWIGARLAFMRGMVAGWITDATGLPAEIESLGIGFFPSPSVDIGGLTIAQPPGFGDEPFATVGRLEIRIPWSGIFRISEVRELSAQDATVRLVVDRDGVANWSRLGGEPSTDAPAPDPAPADWAVDSLRLERGAVDYRDLAAGSHWQLAAISLDANGLEPARAFPFDLKLGGVFGTNTIHFAAKGEGHLDSAAGRYEGRSLEFRGWLGGEPLPLAGAELTGGLARATYEAATGTAIAEEGRFKFAEVSGKFRGRAELDEPATEASVAMTTEPFAPRVTAIILGRPLPATSDPAALESLQLAMEAQLQGGVLRLDPVTGRLDDTNFEASLVPAERFVRARLDRIDLNRYLPPAAKAASKKKATLEDAVAELAELDIDAEIRVEEARVAGALLRDAVIRVERGQAAP
ncbi:MAG TPA: AsmA family protein [Steroidobacteraceae bacterium]|nr:AsmA family protein [Steroidobacteraceae bacterium]